MSAERDISQAQLGDQLIELSSLRAELQQSRIAADLRTSDGTKYQQQLDQLLQSVQRLKQQVSDAELEVKTSQNQVSPQYSKAKRLPNNAKSLNNKIVANNLFIKRIVY